MTAVLYFQRAKPPKAQRAEQHLKRIQRSYHKYHTTLASIKSNEENRLKCDWIQRNNHKTFDSLVQARVQDAMQGFVINTEERRNKLRELLASEENEYFSEMQLKGETVEEKKDKMRERTKLLREKKEKERQEFVAEKLDQQFRDRCEELRTKLASIHEKKVVEERNAQIEFNKELKRQKLVEEQLFARLWEEDRLAKERREAQEEKRQRELVQNTRLGLDAQVTSIQAQRQGARRMKEEEARILEQNKAQIKREDEQEKLQKQKRRQETRSSLKKAVQDKIESMQREYREDLDLNMKLVGRALQDLQDEADKKKQKREEMGREQKIYNDYLMQRREEEKAQEKELNRLLEDIKAKKLAEKDRELALQRAARKQLMNEVMSTRKLQVQERRAVLWLRSIGINFRCRLPTSSRLEKQKRKRNARNLKQGWQQTKPAWTKYRGSSLRIKLCPRMSTPCEGVTLTSLLYSFIQINACFLGLSIFFLTTTFD
uniref:Cilia- and flagella-associated protein 53 n=1 Tax=Mus spicilegus TaxID=10103 RepID=A0A8C6HWT8_MUSSI